MEDALELKTEWLVIKNNANICLARERIMLELKNVSKIYQTKEEKVFALDHINLSFKGHIRRNKGQILRI